MTESAQILDFTRSFDGSGMTIEQIRQKARDMGWPGIRIDVVKWNEGGPLTIMRMSQRRADGETL